ncbi:MAG: phosphoribosylformylglycinamidine synthase subunit PurS [Methanothrix sp.]|nr:phosphoribosylformylglycinamidine synthase subunit PurS [Methanothrix sp.]MCX8206615.1 phosphoribosylformylglycinamidine synthase subunit PurS [Methanothrix sp.]
MIINLRVWLKIPDAEAATVKNTLLRRMGYQGIVRDVKRERLLSIEADDVSDPDSLIKQLTRELVNENKESFAVSVNSLDLSNGFVPVKVSLWIEDGEAVSIRDRLVKRLGLKMIRAVQRANIWKLYIDGDDPESVARRIAEELLVNPNKDRYEIIKLN